MLFILTGHFDNVENMTIGSHCHVTFVHSERTTTTNFDSLLLKTFGKFETHTRGDNPTVITGHTLDLRSGSKIVSSDLKLQFVNISVHSAAEITVSSGLPTNIPAGNTLFYQRLLVFLIHFI